MDSEPVKALALRLIRMGGPGNEMPEVRVGPDMERAFLEDLESYVPAMPGLALNLEAGDSKDSYENLVALMGALGRPTRVTRRPNGNVLVRFPGGESYLATGFDCGYSGTAPYYMAWFGSKAGFGDMEALWFALADMDRTYEGTVWET